MRIRLLRRWWQQFYVLGVYGRHWSIDHHSPRLIDLSGVHNTESNPNVVFRLTLGGVTGTTGNNRFDNILVQGDVIPEPASAGLALILGLVAASTPPNHIGSPLNFASKSLTVALRLGATVFVWNDESSDTSDELAQSSLAFEPESIAMPADHFAKIWSNIRAEK